jgi:uncharacterized protein YkwD
MLRRRLFASNDMMLAAVLVLHVGVSFAGRRSARGACAGAATVPVDDATRRQATRAVVCLVNQVRGRYGMRAVRLSPALRRAALRHSVEMVSAKSFSHVGPAGDTFGARVAHTGYLRAHPNRLLTEALAWGSRASAATLVQQLLHSAPHRQIVLDPGARNVGIGLTLGAPVAGVAAPSSTLALAFGH